MSSRLKPMACTAVHIKTTDTRLQTVVIIDIGWRQELGRMAAILVRVLAVRHRWRRRREVQFTPVVVFICRQLETHGHVPAINQSISREGKRSRLSVFADRSTRRWYHLCYGKATLNFKKQTSISKCLMSAVDYFAAAATISKFLPSGNLRHWLITRLNRLHFFVNKYRGMCEHFKTFQISSTDFQ